MAMFAPDDQHPSDIASFEEQNRHLRHALSTQSVIDQAKGIPMAQHGCTPDKRSRCSPRRPNVRIASFRTSPMARLMLLPDRHARLADGASGSARVRRDLDPDLREMAADARDAAADARDDAANHRDQVADQRDAQTELREALHLDQEVDVDALMARALVRDVLAERRDRRAEARDRAAERRPVGTMADSLGAAADRGQAGTDRAQSGEDRGSSAGDRPELLAARHRMLVSHLAADRASGRGSGPPALRHRPCDRGPGTGRR
jgi:hypothetical protein